MTIHSEHPFADGVPDPLRRFRGRMPAPVTIWAHGRGAARVGWTVSSLVIADGDPAEVLGLLDPDCALADALTDKGLPIAVSLLGEGHGLLADMFAGLAPAPGGAFAQHAWSDADHGPVLDGAVGSLGARLVAAPEPVGWRLLVRARIETVEIGDADALGHIRGAYHIG